MSAVEVIEEIKKLPSEERRKVLTFLQEVERRMSVEGSEEKKSEVDARFKKIADEVFTSNAELFHKLAQ